VRNFLIPTIDILEFGLGGEAFNVVLIALLSDCC
jgi:hypothetical protein